MSKLNLVNEKTERGFAYFKFTDRYRSECSLQESSLASEDAIWFGVNDANPLLDAGDAQRLGIKGHETNGWVAFPVPSEVQMTTRMHLTREQVAELLPLLQHFVDTGQLPETNE